MPDSARFSRLLLFNEIKMLEPSIDKAVMRSVKNVNIAMVLWSNNGTYNKVLWLWTEQWQSRLAVMREWSSSWWFLATSSLFSFTKMSMWEWFYLLYFFIKSKVLNIKVKQMRVPSELQSLFFSRLVLWRGTFCVKLHTFGSTKMIFRWIELRHVTNWYEINIHI